jgi:hypothetical protein
MSMAQFYVYAACLCDTGMKKLTINDAGNMPGTVRCQSWPMKFRIFFGPVPEWNYECRNADAGISLLDADAQLCPK